MFFLEEIANCILIARVHLNQRVVSEASTR